MVQGSEVKTPVVRYRADEDILVIQFEEPRPAITVEIGDGGLVRLDPDTGEVVAFEILSWQERVEAQALPLGVDVGRPHPPGFEGEDDEAPKRPWLPKAVPA